MELSNDEKIEKLRLKELKIARSSLLEFTTHTFPQYEVNWHHRLICDTLDRFVHTNEIPRLMIFAPPRMGKSELVSRRLPAFILGQNPDSKIIACSYSADLASMMNRDVQRIIDSDEYRQLFPSVRLAGDQKGDQRWVRTSDLFEIVGKRGAYRSAGVGGGITGTGADCIVADSIIPCYDGDKKIQDVRPGDLVLSFNHQKSRVEWKPVLATREISVDEIVEIETESGRKLGCTRDHRIFVEESYQVASNCHIGDRLHCIDSVYAMLTVRKGVPKTEIRSNKGNPKGNEGLLLFQGMLGNSSRIQKPQKMRGLRPTLRIQTTEVLREVQTASQHENVEKAQMQNLRNRIPTETPATSVLLTGLRGQNALNKYERCKQSEVHRRKELSGSFSETKAADFRARRWEMSGLRRKRAGVTSYRSRHSQQYSRKLDHDVQKLSHHTAQISKESISKIEKSRRGKFQVYDIHVAENNNFFAQGILVHNCLILDDLIKNQEEADSPTMRKKVWDWYCTTAYTRLEKTGKVCVMLTRWDEDDIAGRLLEQAKKDPEADQWHILKLPALCEEDKHPKDPRKPGEALWPNKYSLKRMNGIKATIGLRAWNAMFQQRPTSASGGILKRSCWNYYDSMPTKFDSIIQSWDMTFKGKETSDYVAGQVWGTVGANCYLLDYFMEQLTFSKSLQAVRTMTQKWPGARAKLVEDKANGTAVVDVLKDEISGLILVEPKGGKVARVHAMSPLHEAGNLWIPKPEKAPWVLEFVESCANFPNAAHDDDVDAMSQAILYLGGDPRKKLMDMLRY